MTTKRIQYLYTHKHFTSYNSRLIPFVSAFETPLLGVTFFQRVIDWLFFYSCGHMYRMSGMTSSEGSPDFEGKFPPKYFYHIHLKDQKMIRYVNIDSITQVDS